jgi:hypothetical protein
MGTRGISLEIKAPVLRADHIDAFMYLSLMHS